MFISDIRKRVIKCLSEEERVSNQKEELLIFYFDEDKVIVLQAIMHVSQLLFNNSNENIIDNYDLKDIL